MAFTDDEQKIINSTLSLDDLGELDGPTLKIELNKREARLLLDALDYYRETRCPMDGKGNECALMFWSEDVHNGAIDKNCIGRCNRLIGELLGQKAIEAFGRGKGPARSR